MATTIRQSSGDRELAPTTVFSALDRAFADRVSKLFDQMCGAANPSQATAAFMREFQKAADNWNEARTAIEREYPKSVVAQQLSVIE